MKTYSINPKLTIYNSLEHQSLLGDNVSLTKADDFVEALQKKMTQRETVEKFTSGETIKYFGIESILDVAKEIFGEEIPAEAVFFAGIVFNDFMNKMGELSAFSQSQE